MNGMELITNSKRNREEVESPTAPSQKFRRKMANRAKTRTPCQLYSTENTFTLTDPTSFHFLLKHRYLCDSSANIRNLTLKSRDIMVRFSGKEDPRNLQIQGNIVNK